MDILGELGGLVSGAKIAVQAFGVISVALFMIKYVEQI